MSDIRDADLGRALARLTTPDHGEDFWSELAERLDAEVRRPAGRIRGRTRDRLDARWVATAAVAAIVALVVAAAAVISNDTSTAPVAIDPDGGGAVTTPEPEQEPPPSTAPAEPPPGEQGPEQPAPSSPEPQQPAPQDDAPPPSAQADPSPSIPGSLAAEVTVEVAGGGERRYTLVADRDGSRHVVAVDHLERVAVDVSDGDRVSVFPNGDGTTTSIRRRGLAAGGPEAATTDPIGDPAIVDHTLALAAVEDPAVTGTEWLGRPAWRLDTEVTPNAFAGPGAPDAVVAVVDRASSLLLLLEERASGELVRRIEVTSLTTSDGPAADDAFQVDGDTDQLADEGFERVALDELGAGPLADAAVFPASVPDGFELATIDVRPGAAPGSGPEGMNPPSVDTVVLTYRRGWEELVVTTRRTGADLRTWEDPYRGEGQVLEPDVVELGRGALSGTTVEVALDPTTTPHLWGAGTELVVTVAGPIPAVALVDVAGSLEAVSG